MLARIVPPKEITEELERLLDEWIAVNDDRPFEDYFDEHGSDKIKAYMEERAGVEDEDM